MTSSVEDVMMENLTTMTYERTGRIARITLQESYDFQQRAASAGFKQAVRERDEPFGDFGMSSFKG
jgi:hypothetical protein